MTVPAPLDSGSAAGAPDLAVTPAVLLEAARHARRAASVVEAAQGPVRTACLAAAGVAPPRSGEQLAALATRAPAALACLAERLTSSALALESAAARYRADDRSALVPAGAATAWWAA